MPAEEQSIKTTSNKDNTVTEKQKIILYKPSLKSVKAVI